MSVLCDTYSRRFGIVKETLMSHKQHSMSANRATAVLRYR